MARNVNDIIQALPASRRKKIERRGAALVAGEMTDEQGEVRELTAEDFKRAVTFAELPESERRLLAQVRPSKDFHQGMISIRLSRDVRKWVRSEPTPRTKAARRK